MPAGTKFDLTITTNTGGNNYKIVTYMTREAINDQVFGPPDIPFKSGAAEFVGLNQHDEEIILVIKREQIQGYMLGPFHVQVQTQQMQPQMVPPNLRGRQ